MVFILVLGVGVSCCGNLTGGEVAVAVADCSGDPEDGISFSDRVTRESGGGGGGGGGGGPAMGGGGAGGTEFEKDTAVAVLIREILELISVGGGGGGGGGCDGEVDCEGAEAFAEGSVDVAPATVLACRDCFRLP